MSSISGVSSSSYSNYTSTSSTSASAQLKKFQEELFASLDTDGNGEVSSDELNTAISNSSSSGTSNDGGILVTLSKNFSSLDSDSDDGLTLDEMAALQPPAPPTQDSAPHTDAVEDLMSAIDSDGSGSIRATS